jgi:hypothetical protein
MNADDFAPFLGKTDDTTEIKDLLQRLGVKKHPKVKRGGYRRLCRAAEEGARVDL